MKKWIIDATEMLWEDAFDKFGYEDGDGLNGTDEVQGVLEELGYTSGANQWGFHNYMIFQIFDEEGKGIIPEDVGVGYADPRDYLPEHIIKHLDKHFYDIGD